MEARVMIETQIRQAGRPSSVPKGRLPEGSVVTIVGPQKADFLLVEVELEDGKTLSGWVNENTLVPFDERDMPRKVRPKRRVRLPKDEMLLLRREPSLFFGGAIGTNYAIIQPSQLSGSEFTYTGLGLSIGGYVGIFAGRQFPIRFELTYLQFNGISPDDNTADGALGYGFLEAGIVPGILLGNFEIFAGLSYALGLSIIGTPVSFTGTLDSPADLSSVAGQIGLGYAYPLTDEVKLGVRVRGTLHFQSGSILRYGIGGVATLGLQG